MLKIGHNANTNMLPLFHFLPSNPNWEWVMAEPAGHNALLANGQIDMAPISLFSYGEHWEQYRIFSNLSVSARGKVGSILLFSKRPLSELDGKLVALTTNSATSVNLTKIILQEFYGQAPMYQTMSAELPAMLASAEAGLLIGDQAIRAAKAKPDCFIYDLGQEWLRHTGYAMTYSVWAFSKSLLLSQAAEVAEIYRLLLAAKEQSRYNLDQIIKECLELVGGTGDFWREYFSNFSYGLDGQLIAGIEYYFDCCTRLNLLPSRPQLNFWP